MADDDGSGGDMPAHRGVSIHDLQRVSVVEQARLEDISRTIRPQFQNQRLGLEEIYNSLQGLAWVANFSSPEAAEKQSEVLGELFGYETKIGQKAYSGLMAKEALNETALYVKDARLIRVPEVLRELAQEYLSLEGNNDRAEFLKERFDKTYPRLEENLRKDIRGLMDSSDEIQADVLTLNYLKDEMQVLGGSVLEYGKRINALFDQKHQAKKSFRVIPDPLDITELNYAFLDREYIDLLIHAQTPQNKR